MDMQVLENIADTTNLLAGDQLSPQQNRLWSLQQVEGGASFRAQCVLLIDGKLDTATLKAAVETVVRNYSILGHACWNADQDLSAQEPAQQKIEIERLIGELSRQPFDFESGLRLRLTLITTSPSEHRLLVALPALCADGATLRVLVREISRAYASEELDEVSMQYDVVSQWLNELLESDEIEAGREYWRSRTSSTLVRHPFEGKYAENFDPQVLSIEIQPDILERLKSLSLAECLLACWQVLLWRHTGQSDVVVAREFDGRTESDLETVIGPLAKFLPVQNNIQANEPFDDFIKRTDEASQEAALWQEAFAGGETAAYCFAYEEEAEEHQAGGLTFRVEQSFTCTDYFKLKLVCRPEGNVLRAEFHYDGRYFGTDGIGYIARQFQTLLAGVANNPEEITGKLSLLSEAERQQQLVEWNDTRKEIPASVHRLFESRVAAAPLSVALSEDNVQLSYGELNERANQLAHHLRTLGVGAESRVAIYLPRSIDLVVTMLAVLKAGGAYVPLDPQYPLERLAQMLEDAQAVAVVTNEEWVDALPSLWAQVVLVDADREAIAQQSTENLNADEEGDALAYLIYTSGSTGIPKGVAVPHRGITRLVCETNYASFSADEVFLQLAPAAFDASTFEIWGALLNGARLAIMPDGQASLAEIGAALRQYEVTTLWLTAGLFHLMVEEQLEALLGLRQLLAGGDVLGVSQVRRFLEAAGGKSRLINGYGPTENTTFSCCHVMVEPSDIWTSVPIGRAVSNTQVYVLDDELQVVPVGVSGELYVGGAGLARGYWNRPEQTAEKFIQSPFETGARLYRTGDLVRYLPDGKLEFIGRADEQVKVRGFRIELGEIETVLSAHAAVREVVVIANDDAAGNKRLVAYVVSDEATDSAQLRAYLKEKLPEYMVPSAVVFLEELPLTPNGKVDRKALPDPEWSSETSSGFVAARTPIEEVLSGIWEQVLSVEHVGVHDNFFDLGGHSLLATQVISRMRESFNVELPLRVIFESPTIAESAAEVEAAMRHEGAEPPPLKPVSRDELLPLSFAQQRLWFLDQLEPGNANYNIFTALRLTGRLDTDALEQTLSEILRRHETLRTTFAIVDGRPVQVISPADTFEIPILDLSGLAEPELMVQQRGLEEAQRPFDLASGLMIRACLLRLSDEEHVLLFTMHHIASDGWSIGVLVREVVALYEAYSNNQPSPLPELALQYADFAQWQREWLQDTVLDAQLSYWKKQLAGAQEFLELPTDRPRPSVQTFRGATHTWSLSQTLTEQLEALSRREGVTLYMTLLAAYATLLYRYSGQDDILIGTPIANRNRAETEPLIGFFVNTLVLRTDLSGNPTFKDLLNRVREASLDGYLHQDLPFEKLVDELQPERGLSHHPLFQVMFIFNNAPMPELKLPGLTMSGVDFHSGIAKFDTTLIMMSTESGLRGVWEYNLDLFDAATAARMVGHFNAILESIVADEEPQPIDEITLVSKDEEQQLLVEWNDTARPYSRERCLHELFEAQDPNALAVAFKDESLTYGELNRRANQLARHLISLGVGPEVMVGILTERSIEWVVGLLGILKAGGAYVCLDPSLPRERLAFMAEDAGVRVLLTQQKFTGAEDFKAVCLDSDWEKIAAQSDQNPERRATEDNAAYVVYTSGSTGRPKGVVINHGSILNLLSWHWSTFAVTANDRASQIASMGFDAAVWELWPYLTAGASIHIIDEETRYSPAKVREFFDAHQISIGWLPPSLAEGVLISEDLESLPLRVLLTGSDRVLLHPPETAGFDFLNTYGPTEATVIVTSGTIAPLAEDNGAPHIGRPLDNTQIYILDRRLQPCPIGVSGELFIGGDNLARGYLNRPELTAEKFVPSPFSDVPGARLYKSGDLARYRVDGKIEFMGRIDHQVKIRGFRIELGEIETTLLQHHKLEAAIVIAREDKPGEKRLVAYIVARSGMAIAGGELRDYLHERLPEYMLPSAFVELSALPLTRNGKVDRRALPAPDYTLAADDADFVSPRTPLEESLAGMWGLLLSVERVSVNQNFFEAGGHSLLATQLVSHVREAFEVELPLRDFFESPTVAGLAAAVERARQTQPDWQPARIEALPRSEQSLDDLLAELDQLSDEDAQTLLADATRPVS